MIRPIYGSELEDDRSHLMHSDALMPYEECLECRLYATIDDLKRECRIHHVSNRDAIDL